MSEDAIKALQAVVPPGAPPPPAVEVENVAPGLLLPPPRPRSVVAAALAGGNAQLGDRVACLAPAGVAARPPLGARGTVRAPLTTCVVSGVDKGNVVG